jgi:hypothetical protein
LQRVRVFDVGVGIRRERVVSWGEAVRHQIGRSNSLVFSKNKVDPVNKVDDLIWSAFTALDTYPTVQHCTFILRLALARERESQKNVITGMQKAASGRCEAQFRPLHSLPGGFLIKVSVPGASDGFNAELIKPQIDPRLEVHVDVAAEQTERYTGAMVEGFADDVDMSSEHNWDFVAQVQGIDYQFSHVKHKVSLEFIDDSIY